MFNFLFKESYAKLIIEKITKEVNSSLDKHGAIQDEKFELVLERLEVLRSELSGLEQRLNNKELKDRADYGHIQYKISSLQNDLIFKK